MGYLWHACFWDFLDRETRFRLQNCSRTFFIQIPKNWFLHFSKFEVPGAQRGNTGVSPTFIILHFLGRKIRYYFRNCTQKPISVFFQILIPRDTKGWFSRVNTGYPWHSCFWDFLGRKIRYNFRNCTKTFFIQIPENQFLHFSKFELQRAQRVKQYF